MSTTSQPGRGRVPRRLTLMGESSIQFPVTPMLDMAFQLLAFFVLTFQSPTTETRLDLYLPTTPIALPGASTGQARTSPPKRFDLDLENDLLIRARADDLGDLKSLKLGDAMLADVAALGSQLTRYASVLDGRPLRVRIVADDRLRYEVAAAIIGTCNAVGVSSIRLADPAAATSSDATAPGDRP